MLLCLNSYFNYSITPQATQIAANNNCSNFLSALCPRGWVSSSHGECFKVSSNPLNWTAAQSACEALGSNLAVLNSIRKLREFPVSEPAVNVWIGLHRDAEDKSRWLWVGGSHINFAFWDTSEPNVDWRGQECAGMRMRSRRWYDLSCKAKLRYICEYGR